MDKIPFAKNLQECLPKEYGQNLAEMTEKHLMAMYEDNRRWRECEERFKPYASALQAYNSTISQKPASKKDVLRESSKISAWIDYLRPEIYRNDMRRRINSLRENYKNV